MRCTRWKQVVMGTEEALPPRRTRDETALTKLGQMYTEGLARGARDGSLAWLGGDAVGTRYDGVYRGLSASRGVERFDGWRSGLPCRRAAAVCVVCQGCRGRCFRPR